MEEGKVEDECSSDLLDVSQQDSRIKNVKSG